MPPAGEGRQLVPQILIQSFLFRVATGLVSSAKKKIQRSRSVEQCAAVNVETLRGLKKYYLSTFAE